MCMYSRGHLHHLIVYGSNSVVKKTVKKYLQRFFSRSYYVEERDMKKSRFSISDTNGNDTRYFHRMEDE